MVYFLLIVGVLLNTLAQLLLKAGMNQIGQFAFSGSNILPITLRVATNAPIVAGLFAYAISVVVWLLVLSRVQVSWAYPMLSIGYVINALAAYYFFGEDLTFMRIAGMVVIMIGVFLISRTSGA